MPSPRRAGTRRGDPSARLDRRLLLGADDVVAGVQALALPAAGVEIEDRPALAAKFGSRGKIHERCCQGLMASSVSHRQPVTPEICLAIPRAIASRASSEEDHRNSGTPL
jgi:hypothetical protein